jgi:hypothetical protein
VDDVVDGIAIQLGGGYVGLLSVPLFKDDGLVTNPSTSNAWVYPTAHTLLNFNYFNNNNYLEKGITD